MVPSGERLRYRCTMISLLALFFAPSLLIAPLASPVVFIGAVAQALVQ